MEYDDGAVWLIEEQLAYALGASAGDERVMRQAEAMARWRYVTSTCVMAWYGWLLLRAT